ncbi:MAG: Gfo/Idh/MocA family oxidoreductase [Spirochaetes bacterium]|nr:Gfo/Idh/MocA family oxidoreductase [Spirochaetota bacterium]
MATIRVGLIGFGMMGRMQAEGCFRALGDRFRIVCVCDDYPSHLEEARALLGTGMVAYYSDWRRMLEDCEFDLAAIVTPDHLHEEMALECLRKGRHLRLEKPMALDPAGCRRIAEEAKRSGKVVQIGLELRYAELTDIMREAAKGTGRTKMLWCSEFRHPFLAKPGSVPDWNLRRKYSGGTLVEKCCHHFDLFNLFAGARPISVYASGDGETEYPHTNILDNAFATVEYGNGIRANLSLCMFAPRKAKQEHLTELAFGILGSAGRIEMRDDKLFVWDRPTGSERRFAHQREDGIGHNDEITPSLLDLAACIEEGRTPQADIRAGFNSVLVSWAAELSAAEKRVVTIEEVERRFDAPWME